MRALGTHGPGVHDEEEASQSVGGDNPRQVGSGSFLGELHHLLMRFRIEWKVLRIRKRL